ncbi:MAG: DNA repair protein RecO [Candidatus Omnitrophota bacterium]|nr:DNA repair protein RecO [Candidatus Omnitrophota bacterium]
MIQKTQAVVLKTFNLRETSKIAVFYSQEFGKIKGLLKGIRADAKKFATNLELTSLNELIFYRKYRSDLHLVSQCDLKEDFPSIREDLKKSLAANYCLELINSIMPLEDRNEEVFKLLVLFLKDLSALTEIEKLIYLFQVKILSISGFKPHLDSCVVCNKKIEKDARFSHNLGGLVCSDCAFKDRNSQTVLMGTTASILHIEKSTWAEALRLGISFGIRQELNSILNQFLTFHLERPLKTLRFYSKTFFKAPQRNLL